MFVLPGGGPKVACRCLFLPVSGRWVGFVVRRLWRCTAATGTGRPRVRLEVARAFLTMVYQACAVRCASAVRVVTPTDASWTRASPQNLSQRRVAAILFLQTYLLGYLKPTFRKSQKAIVLVLATYMFLICFAKWPAPRVALHNASLFTVQLRCYGGWSVSCGVS